MKRIFALLLSITVISTNFSGCTSTQQKFSSSQETSYVNSYIGKITSTYVSTTSSSSVSSSSSSSSSSAVTIDNGTLISDLDKNISKLTKDDSTRLVDALVYAMTQSTTKYSNEVAGLLTQYQDFSEQNKNFNYNSPKNLSRITDNTLKTLVQDIQNSHLRLDCYNNEEFLVHVDYEYILNKYEKYINDDLKALIVYSQKQDINQFYNSQKNQFDLDIVVSRIILAEQDMSKYSSSVYLSDFKNDRNYYLQVYFGVNNDHMYDNNKKILSNVLTHYTSTLKKYPKSTLASDIKEFETKLKKTKNIVTADIKVWLIQYTGYENSSTTSSSTSSK